MPLTPNIIKDETATFNFNSPVIFGITIQYIFFFKRK